MSTLFVVSTPIGNLEDITFRAVRVLNEVDVIACEDTRVTKRLLENYDIDTKTVSYHTQSSNKKENEILEFLEEGKDVALVSDSGTPTISDPGVHLVRKVLNSLSNSVKIVSIPGPSALIAAVSISGISVSEFLYFGFLPHKKGRETKFKEISESKRTVVFYESPHRIEKTLESLNEVATKREVVLLREMTKIYEDRISGKPKELLEVIKNDKNKQKGEFVVVVSAK